MVRPVIVIHGGAGTLSKEGATTERLYIYEKALMDIVAAGQAILEKGGSAVDAVTLAVQMFEDNTLFNCGKGSVMTHQGTFEMDSCLMEGKELNAGAVCCVHRIKNPILASRAVLEKSPHVLLTSEGAEKFAELHGLEMVDGSYFSTPLRVEELQRLLADKNKCDSFGPEKKTGDPIDHKKKLGTVGAVALDAYGNMAAATSTGGICNKQFGRVGDTPLAGIGCYADNNTCAIACTGVGEVFIRTVAAHEIVCRMKYCKMPLKEACDSFVMDTLPPLGGDGGLVAIDKEGNIAMPYNCEGMYRGYGYVGETPKVAIYKD